MSLGKHGIELHRPLARAPLRVRVIGERSSGTNYVRRLFADNTGLDASQCYGWKHGFAQMSAIGAETLVVGVVRDPLDWLRSMYAKPWHSVARMQELDFSAFIRAEWHSHVDRARYFPEHGLHRIRKAPLQQDLHPLTGLPFANVLRLRTAKARFLLSHRHRGCNLVLVRYESVRDRPLGFLNLVAARFGLERVPSVRPITRRLGSRFRPAVENRPAPPDEISPADMAFIRAELDTELEAELGYALDPALPMRTSLAASASQGRP